jgi:glutaredoxin
MMLTLYQAEWCPYTHPIRQLMTELGLTYTTVNVPADREARTELLAVSGQEGIPVLVDGDKVLTDLDEILEHLRSTYPAPEDARKHAAQGAWRAAGAVSLAPRATLVRLKEVLEEKGFKIVMQVRGPKISERLPKEYVLLYVTTPAAAEATVGLDPLAPGAVLVPMAVLPTADGNAVVAMADPVGQVWLFGNPELNRVRSALKKRLIEVLDAL